MKFEMLRKRIVIEGIATAIGLMLSLAIGIVASGWHEDQADESTKMKRTLLTTAKRLETINNKYETSRQSLDIYTMLKERQTSGELELSRKFASNLLNRLKDEYKLTHLSLSMSPAEVIQNKEFQRKNAQVVSSDMKLKFSGISDSQLFSFLQALQIELGGYVRVTALTLDRTGNIDEKSLRAISKGNMPELVKGDVTLEWLGLRKTEQQNNG